LLTEPPPSAIQEVVVGVRYPQMGNAHTVASGSARGPTTR
jgi:hypothetical protein